MAARREQDEHQAVRSVTFAAECGIATLFEGADLAEAFAIRLEATSAAKGIDGLTRSVLGDQAPWVRFLLGLRDLLVAGFGLKTSGQLRAAALVADAEHIDFFRVLARSDREV